MTQPAMAAQTETQVRAPLSLPVSVMVVSEIRLFAEGLSQALARDPRLSIMSQCSRATDVLARLAGPAPEVLLLDAAFPDGPVLARQARQAAPALMIIAAALAETPADVIAWAQAGVAGYIPRSAGIADIVPLLLGIAGGEQVCSPAVAAGLIRHLRDAPLPPPPPTPTPYQAAPDFTARETQIVSLICAGMSNKEIARRLNIGVSTTKSHVHNLLGKLDVRQRSLVAIRMVGQNLPAHPPLPHQPHPLSSP